MVCLTSVASLGEGSRGSGDDHVTRRGEQGRITLGDWVGPYKEKGGDTLMKV